MQIRYIGPSGQVNYSVGIECGNSNLEPDKVYDVSDKLGEALVFSSSFYEKVKDSKEAKDSKPVAEEQE